MRGAFLFLLVVPFAALVSDNALQNEDLKVFQRVRWVEETMQAVFLVNRGSQIPNARSNGTKCSEQMALLQEGLTNGSLWALKMIDASSKIPSGLLMGNRIDFGMFDECVGISVNEGGQEIRGRHCMYTILARVQGLPFSETLSICLPAACESGDVQIIVRNALEQVGLLVGTNTSLLVGETTCTTVDPPEWTTGGIVTLIGFSLLLLFLVVCTICDIYPRYSGKKPPLNGPLDILRQFSFYSNAVYLLSTKTTPQTLPALQGLRVFSMCWVIWAHGNLMFIQAAVNLVEIVQWIPSWESLYVLTAPFAVDSFFTISGFLMSYTFLKEMSSGQRFNLFSYYLHRYLRLTPALVAVLLSTIFIAPHIGSGATWEKEMNFEVQACRNSWWTMLLYLHNYINTDTHICLGHTWYLAAEMHYFWISPLILYPLAKKPKIGLGIFAALFIASIVTSVKIGYDNEFSTAMIANSKFDRDTGFIVNFYLVSHVRAAPWLIGMFFGYLISTQKGSSTSKVTKGIGWLLAIAAFSFCIFTMRIFQSVNYNYDDVWESIYTALARPLWGFVVSWVIYACARGFGGPVSMLLSLPIYTPLTRISYCIYLVHHEIQFMKARAARMSGYFNTFNVFNNFLSDLMLSIMAGLVFTLIFESPFLVLERIIKTRRGRTKNDSKKVLKEEEVEKGIDNSGLAPS